MPMLGKGKQWAVDRFGNVIRCGTRLHRLDNGRRAEVVKRVNGASDDPCLAVVAVEPGAKPFGMLTTDFLHPLQQWVVDTHEEEARRGRT